MIEKDRPPSVVAISTGFIGLVGLLAAVVYLIGTDIAVASKILILLGATALPMIVWELAVEKVHRRPSTGLDFSIPASGHAGYRRVAVKLFGLAVTWTAVGVFYWLFKSYDSQTYQSYLQLISALAPLLFVLAIPYFFFMDRYSVEPEDSYWHTGQFFLGRFEKVSREIVIDHFLGWAIKAFFLAFMVSILPYAVHQSTSPGDFDLSTDIGAFVMWCVQLLFLFDVCFGTVGYIFTFKFLDTHIRSANPYLAGWMWALMCYPPFILMGDAGPLQYHDGRSWIDWLGGNDFLMWIWGGALIFLTAVYAWATVIFGLRFSNLTHRGIITNGPYRFLKHPAYVSKNIYWWVMYMPFLAVAGLSTALQNCALLLVINMIYFMRAMTEEKHLSSDPAYQEYAAWMDRNGPFRWASPSGLRAHFKSSS